MRNLLPFLFLFACPVMMIFMMRGMSSGHGTAEAGPDTRMGHGTGAGQNGPVTPDLQTANERIDALEHELVQLRDLRGRQSDHDQTHQR